jgi:oleandomycin transport system ATP-binding protein
MWSVVRKLVSDGSTVLLTTQYLDEADALADEITVIDHGKVIANDTPDGLKRVIGGQRIEVRPTDAARLEEVNSILARIAGSAPVLSGRNTLSVAVASEAALPAVVTELTTSGISVTELSLHLPSLDEVFMTLTGRTASAEESAA